MITAAPQAKQATSSAPQHSPHPPFFSPMIQPKLTINQSNDVYEQEADAVAEQMMRMPEQTTQAEPFFKPALPVIQRRCSHCEEKEKMLSRKEENQQPVAGDSTIESYTAALATKGRTLTPEELDFFEPRFRYDFSGVQLHTDAAAGQSAKSISALAYTHRNHIVFGAGQYQPHTSEGRKLMAHELTHVVQQQGRSTGIQRRDAPRYYSYTTDDYVQQVKDALAERNPIAGVGNPAEAYNILNGIETVQLETVLLRLGIDNLSILRVIQSPSHSNSIRTELFVKTAYFILAPSGGIVDTEVMNIVVHLELLDQPQTDELKKFMQQNAELVKVFEAQQCKYSVAMNQPPLSYELADAPCGPDQKTRVKLWLQANGAYIKASENKFSIDRRAIAGAIAWEAIENIRGSWTPSSVGPGKVHIKRHPWSISHSGTVADQVEESGYLPERTSEEREKILKSPPGAIEYIAAIMKAGADIAYREGKFDISRDPLVLTWFYNSKDLPGWTALIKAKAPGSAFTTKENAMSHWTDVNLQFLEQAVGKPAFISPFAKAAAPIPASPAAPASPAPVQRKCAPCGEEPIVQRAHQSMQHEKAGSGTASYIDQIPAGGAPLSKELKHFFEPKFGYDFSQVQLHTDDEAARSADRIQALAYTHGNSIVFGTGQYQPGTEAGKKLMAHELTHVVQQSRQPQHSLIQRSDKCDPDGVCVHVDDGISQTIKTPFKNIPPLYTTPNESPLPLYTLVAPVAANSPQFSRDAGCNLEAPATPAEPSPLPFTPDLKAILPDKEATPSLNEIPSGDPWWTDKAAEAFGQALAVCYAARTAASAKPVDAALKLDELQKDFNSVVEASFARSGRFGVPWHNLPAVLQRILQDKHKKLLDSETAGNNRLPKDKRLSPDDVKQNVETQMQVVRHDLIESVRKQVALGTWGWMAERREKLDFDTLKMNHPNSKLSYAHLPDNLTDPEIYAISHNILVAKKKELTEADIAKVEEAAKKDKAKASKDAAAELTDEEKKLAVDKAELKKVTTSWKTEFDSALTKERARKDALDLVIPDAKYWELDSESSHLSQLIAKLSVMITGSKADKDKIAAATGFIKSWQVSKEDTDLQTLRKEIIESLAKETDEIAALKQITDFVEKVKAHKESVKNSKEGNKINNKVAEVLEILATEFPQGFRAGNYAGHGGGSFRGRFHSADMYPNQSTSRVQQPFGEIGFFDKQTAFDFALAIDRSVGKKGGSFQILYNDFTVAREVNKLIKNGIVINTDNVETDAREGYAKNLNWHGPLVTHFHVDFVLP